MATMAKPILSEPKPAPRPNAPLASSRVPPPLARLSNQRPDRRLTHTCRCGSPFVGAPSTADINQRVQVPSVEEGTKRGEP